MSPVTIVASSQTWPLASAFVISRGSKTAAEVVVVEAAFEGHTGRGEAVPYARYGETVAGVLAAIERTGRTLDKWGIHPPGEVRRHLQLLLPAGAARNAIDCALWDLAAKCAGRSVAALAGLPPPSSCLTAYTLSLDIPEAMAARARGVAHLPLLKLKLGGEGDDARLRAVRAARPDARIVADANEAWTAAMLPELLAVAIETGVELIEQPLPAGADAILERRPRGVAICADESLHTRADLAVIAQRYDAINIKLDKTGGLTEALALSAQARALGLRIMAGCMVATSLAMAPALLIAQDAEWVDLDGPLLLARDREPGLVIRDGIIAPPNLALWG